MAKAMKIREVLAGKQPANAEVAEFSASVHRVRLHKLRESLHELTGRPQGFSRAKANKLLEDIADASTAVGILEGWEATLKLTLAEKRLLKDLEDAPIPLHDADRRRPFFALQEKKLVKHNGWTMVQGHFYQAWALTKRGHEIAESLA
jgi:hypothetical protein